MFNVDNADFIAEKLSKELLPNQEFREVLKNALEAIERRCRADGTKVGRVEFDVDWVMHQNTPGRQWFISCADNGDGMTRSELERYTTTLAVQGAGRNQSIRGNQGMGLKISGPTRHKKGVLIRSLKNGERTMVQIGWNEEPGEYGLMPLARGELVQRAPEASFPKFINEQGSGTVVTFLGSADMANTFVPADTPKGWLFKYLHTRFFRLSKDGVEVVVRVPTGAPEEWPNNWEEAQARMRKEGGRSFNLSMVYGTGEVWDGAASKAGGDKGVVQLAGDATLGIPPANLHWWVLPAEGADVSSRTQSGGSFAVLYQNELHDWKTGNHAGPYFARLGVLFGKSRIAFVLEPEGTSVASDFARAHVLISGQPVFESEAWILWAEQFKRDTPESIKRTIAEEHDRLKGEDPDRMKRIRDRLREVMQLLRPRRFRRAEDGSPRSGPEVTGAGTGAGSFTDVPVKAAPSRRKRASGRGLGAVLADLEDMDAAPAVEVATTRDLEPIWVSEEESENMSIVNGNGSGMHDRAAALAGQDGRTATVLLLNKEFRGYQTMLAAVNEWANPTGDEMIASRVEALVREWTEQKMIEAVEGLRQLENGRTWLTEHYDDALSPVALTAAFMADRYHTLREVKRAVGGIRQATATT